MRGWETESEGIPVVPASASVPVSRHLPPEAAASAGSSPRRKWIFALAGLVLVGIAGVAVQLGALHHRSLWISSTTSSIFAKSQPKTSSQAISDPEKRQARNLYLKGRYEWNQRTPDSLNRALDDFTQAVVHDPNDAKSYVGLADTYNLLQIYSILPLTDSYPRAIAAARRAVELDDSLAEAHRALAFSEFYGAGDWRESEKEFRRAIQLDPKDPVTRRWYANAFAVPGRYEESLEQFDKARELDPSSHSTLSDMGIILFNAGKTEEGIALLKDVERTNPEFFSPHAYLMEIGFERHDFRTFLDEGQKAAEVRNDPVLRDIIASARVEYERGGKSGLVKELYAKQKEYYAMGKYPPGLLAMTCVAMGKRQEALHLLEVAYSRHEADALWCLTDPELRTLKDEPRYKELVRKINFPGPTDGLPGASAATEKSPLRASD
jgi:tetratricopeptide (TPR) repeat protein